MKLSLKRWRRRSLRSLPLTPRDGSITAVTRSRFNIYECCCKNSVMAKFAEWMLCDVREREDVEALSSLYGTPSLSARQAYCRAPPLFQSPSHPAPLPSSDVLALRRSSPLPGSACRRQGHHQGPPSLRAGPRFVGRPVAGTVGPRLCSA